jgi:predicted aspartyl protease
MTHTQEPVMGRFSVEVELANHRDQILADNGHLPSDKVRRIRVRGVVDNGATRLVIPETVAKALGAEISGSVRVRYADGRLAERPIANDIHLTYGGRDSVFNAIVEPARESVLIGAIVREDLDFLIDCTGQRLIPRDPDRIISEVE